MDSSSRPAVAAGAAALPLAPRPSATLAALALALLLGLQPVTTDAYLPALPMLARDLQAPMSAAQMTMAGLILAFGLAQLVWGPVADRIGRRPVLILGLALYTVASVAAVFAPSIELLVLWRVVQGACLASAVVVARAIVRDLYEPHEGARVMSIALSGLGVIACLTPAVGGLVAGHWGWRAALGLLAAMGAFTFAFVVLRLPETLVHRNPRATALAPLVATWAQIARHPSFVAWTLLTAFTYGGLFTFLAGSSFVYIDMLGLSPGAYGLAMASGSIAYLAGTFVCRRWIVKLGVERAVQRGALFTLAGGLLVLALALAGVHAVAAVLVPQWLFCFGHGIHQPCGQSGAVGPFPRAAGAASALAGFALSVVAFADGRWLGAVLRTEVLPFAATVAFWSVATAAVAWTLVRRLRKTPA
jgi:MFS transporter, DHA1 family, multidrug resistance protein